MFKNRLLGPWRRSGHWLLSLLILLLPWAKIDSHSLLRIDIPKLSLHLFGATLRIEELYLLLLFTLACVFFFLLATLVMGRVWCGWACPQTSLSDLTEWVASRLKLKNRQHRLYGSAWRKLVLHFFILLLALLVGSNLLWYFIEPQRYFTQLFTGQLHPVALGTLLTVTAAVYLDLALLRRLFCRDFCPYGRFQSALVDSGSLILQRPLSEAPRCIDCGACVRACPMGIDIRHGEQIECINCGRCLDACRQVMAKRQQPGLINYSFGTSEQGLRSLINPRTRLLTGGLCVILLLLAFSIQTRPQASLKIALSHQVASRRLANGNLASFFNAWINNRTTDSAQYLLRAQQQNNRQRLELKGPTRTIVLSGGQNRKIDFVLLTPFTENENRVTFTLYSQNGQPLAEAEALITPIQSR